MKPAIPIKVTQQEADDAIMDYVQSNDQPFNVYKHICPNDFEMGRTYERKFDKLVKMGILEHCRDERGWYRPRRLTLERMDIEGAIPEPVDIWLPFELSDLAEVYPGNILMFAGSKSAGKSCAALNILRENENKFDRICYFNSEMGAAELKKRLNFFNRPSGAWKAEFYSRYDEFDSAVQPGVNTLNVIDFLEVHDEYAQIGGKIKAIHDSLKDSVCVIFIQKNQGNDLGLGGARSIEVSRLYVAMDKGKARITDAKNWVDPHKNPNGLVRQFKIFQGTQISHKYPWGKEIEDE